MWKKSIQTLLLISSTLLLLVSATASASGQNVSGTIRWRKDFGVVPMGPGHSQAAVNPCSIFSVAALDVRNNSRAAAYTDQIASPFRYVDGGDYNICRYTLRVPERKSLYITATMGGVLLLPKEDRSPYLITGPWIGGGRSKPPAGYERGFTGHQYVTLYRSRQRVIVNFEMVYVDVRGPR